MSKKDTLSGVANALKHLIDDSNKFIKQDNNNNDKNTERFLNAIEKRFNEYRHDLLITRPRLATKGIKSDMDKLIYSGNDFINKYNDSNHNNNNRWRNILILCAIIHRYITS